MTDNKHLITKKIAGRWQLSWIKSVGRVLVIGFSTLTMSCGGNQIALDIVLASNSSTNPLKKISTDMQLGLSAGVFFVLDELEAAPVSIDDTKAGGDTFSDPSASSSVGNDPLQGSFKISTTSLKSGSFYRIKMFARDANGVITHTGTGDCPVRLSLKETNTVKICFGNNDPSDPPLCPGLTVFTDCPGL